MYPQYIVSGKWGIVHEGVCFTKKHVKRFIYVVDAHFIDKIEEKKILHPNASDLMVKTIQCFAVFGWRLYSNECLLIKVAIVILI